MGKFHDANKDSDLGVLERELKKAHAEALKDPSQIEDFVQMLSLIMAKNNRIKVNDNHINYVTSRLLNSPQKTNIATGEGRSFANMLFLASQHMLNRETNLEFTPDPVMKRNINDFGDFFKIIGFNIGVVSAGRDSTYVLSPIRSPNPIQLQGRVARVSDEVDDDLFQSTPKGPGRK